MCYYSEGTFQFIDVYQMPIHLRNFYYKKLVNVKQKENEALKNNNSKSKASPKISKPF